MKSAYPIKGQFKGVGRRFSLAIRFIGTGVALAWVLHRVDPNAALSALGTAPPWMFCLPVSVVSCTTALQTWRLRLVLSAMGEQTSALRIVAVLCQGSFLGLTLPSGGQELAKAALLTRVSGRLDITLAALLSVRMLQLPTWIGLLLWGLVWGLWRTHPLLGLSATGFILVAGGVLLAMIWGVSGQRPNPSGRPMPRWIPLRIASLVQRMRHSFFALRDHVGTLVMVTLLAVPCGLLNIVLVWQIALGFSVPIDLSGCLALIPAADVVNWMPISLAGVGVRESVMVQVFGPLGVAESTAIAVGFVRWTGELFRAALGGILFLLGDTVGPSRANMDRSDKNA
jgi:uncharacterized membrane protein YbhN (UPF0104 family)